MTRRQRPPKLGDRLRAWWEGTHPHPAEPSAPAGDHGEPAEPLVLDAAAMPLLLDTPLPPVPGAPEPVDPARPWSARRIAAAELLWGPDFLSPGGAALTVALAEPLGLGATHQLLELGAALGGGSRALAQAYGAWVTALEPDPDLAEEAQRRSKAARLEKQAAIRPIALDGLVLRERGFDAAFSREVLCGCADKPALLAALHAGLKDGGQLLLTDFVLRGPTTAALRTFLKGEPNPPDPWPAQRLTQAFDNLGFELRLDDDITDIYVDHAGHAWANLAQSLDADAIPRRLLRPVSDECERWGRRFQALQSGALGVFRYHAMK